MSTNHQKCPRAAGTVKVLARMPGLALVMGLSLCLGTLAAQDFQRGDANVDGNLSIADPIFMLAYLGNGEPVSCMDAADANDDGEVNIVDPVFMLHLLFEPGAAPLPAPAGTCGSDPTADALDCADFSGCP